MLVPSRGAAPRAADLPVGVGDRLLSIARPGRRASFDRLRTGSGQAQDERMDERMDARRLASRFSAAMHASPPVSAAIS